MKCIIFGGAGFIGSHLVKRLLEDGLNVTVVDNFSSSAPSNLASAQNRVILLQADIRSKAIFEELDPYTDIAFHLAFPTPICNRNRDKQFHEIATIGTLNVLDWCTENDIRLIYGSSISVYGQNADGSVIDENTPVSPYLPYAVNKYYGELMATSYQNLYGLRYDSIRISDVYGPRDQRRNAVNNFVDAALASKHIQLQGDGTQRRNFTFVGDIAEGLLRVGRSPAQGQTIILADPTATSVVTLAKAVYKVCNSDMLIQTNNKKDSRDYVFTPQLFISRFGDLPWTPLMEGLMITASARGK